MQAKKRYILVVLSCAFLAYCYFGGYRIKLLFNLNVNVPNLPSFVLNQNYINYHNVRSSLIANNNHKNNIHNNYSKIHKNVDDLFNTPSDSRHHSENIYSNQLRNNQMPSLSVHKSQTNYKSSCTMETCFDYTKCYDNFLVYVYPPEPFNSLGTAPPTSPNYQKILTAIMESRYYTADPEKACLFVLGIDTLDRDSLSEDLVSCKTFKLLLINQIIKITATNYIVVIF